MIYTIIDLETTGTDRARDDILEVGYLQTNEKFEVLRSGAFYFYKEEYDVESAQGIHGLTRDYLKQYEDDFSDNVVRLYTLCRNGIMIGKNSDNFDLPFIVNFFKKYTPELGLIKFKDTLDMEKVFNRPFRAWYQKTYGESAGRRKGKLGELMQVIDYTPEMVNQEFHRCVTGAAAERDKAHGALYDVFMTYLLFVEGSRRKFFDLEAVGSDLTEEQRALLEIENSCEELFESPDCFLDIFPKALRNIFLYYEKYKGITVNYETLAYKKLITCTASQELMERVLSDCRGQAILKYRQESGSGICETTIAFTIEIAYWFIEMFSLTKDVRFIKLGRAFWDYMGFLPKEKADIEPYTMSLANSNNNTLKAYVEYCCYLSNNADISLPTALTDPSIKGLLGTNPNLFWKKLAPAARLFSDYFNQYISWTVESTYAIMQILALQGGII